MLENLQQNMWENQLRELNLSLKNKKIPGEFNQPPNNQEKETPYVTRRMVESETAMRKDLSTPKYARKVAVINLEQSQEEQEIVCHGRVMRFKPGLQNDFVPRWLQMTADSVKYFDRDIRKAKSYRAPLTSVPLTAIKRVSKVNYKQFELPVHRNFEKMKGYYDNLFEIVVNRNHQLVPDIQIDKTPVKKS